MGLSAKQDGFAHGAGWICPQNKMGSPAKQGGFADDSRMVLREVAEIAGAEVPCCGENTLALGVCFLPTALLSGAVCAAPKGNPPETEARWHDSTAQTVWTRDGATPGEQQQQQRDGDDQGQLGPRGAEDGVVWKRQ